MTVQRFYTAAALLLAVMTAPAAYATPAGDGRALFETCVVCHGARGEGTESGPDLRGVVGRKAATQSDYPYSAAMRRSGKVWSQAELAAFLRSPQTAVPGTRMAYPGASSSAEAKAIAAYLANLR